jgi:hypothetical protein
MREVSHSNVPGQRAFAIDFNEDQEQVVDWVYEEADARLICAAPDLLEALIALLASVEGVPCGPEKQCRAAIAKARGQS